MSHEALSPEQLGEHVRAIAKSNKQMTDQEGEDFAIHDLAKQSHFRCGEASGAVEEHLDAVGVKHTPREYSTQISYMSNHYATEVPTTKGPHIVDLAYSQYDDEMGNKGKKRAPWPLVEPKAAYLKRSGFTSDEDFR